MPQEMKKVNGRWIVTGSPQSSDLVPFVKPKAAAPKPAAGPKPAAKPKPKPWWEKLGNDALYELKQLAAPPLQRNPLREVQRAVTSPLARAVPQQIGLGMVGAIDNTNRMAYSLYQRHVQKKPKADPGAGRVGETLDRYVDTAYRVLGATPPSQMDAEQREADLTRRSLALNAGLALVPGAGLGALAAKTGLGATVRGAGAWALNEVASNYLDDNTGGNVVNLINQFTGAKLPGAVDVGNADMVDAANQSLVPNTAAGLALGGAVGLGASAFRNIQRRTRAGRAVQAEAKERAFQENAGLIEKNEDGSYPFTQQARQPAEPAPVAPAQAAAIKPASDVTGLGGYFEQLGAGVGDSLRDGLWSSFQQGSTRFAGIDDPALAAAKQAGISTTDRAGFDSFLSSYGTSVASPRSGASAASPMDGFKAANAAMEEQLGMRPPEAAPAADTTESFGKAQPGELPQDDLDADPWGAEYDPSLPESTALGRVVDELSDQELLTIANNPGLSVVERVNQTIEARGAIEAPPPLSAQMVMAPTDRLADDYLQRMNRALGAREDYELRQLFDPETSPQLWQRAQGLSGVDDPSQLSRSDMLDTFQAFAGEGQAPITNRMMGAQMLPTGDIKAAPTVFQYKEGVNEAGEQIGNSLAGLERWDPDAEGIPQVWRDVTGEIGPAGQTYVVNGHNRLAAASRMGIPSLRVEFLDAPTAAEARLQGAISNVSDGKGTVFDAAKLAREYGITDEAQMKALGKPGASGFWKDGIALGRLPEDIFTAAVNDQIKVGRAVIIGKSGADEETMRSAYRYLIEQGPDNVSESRLRQMMAMAARSPAASSAAADQGDILKGTEWSQTFNAGMLAKADLATAVEQMLKREKKLFGTVGRSAGQIERVGQVDAAAAKEISGEASRAFDLFERMKFLSGPIGDLLNENVSRVVAGQSAADVARSMKNRLVVEIKRLMGQEVAPATDVVQEDKFGAAGRAADDIQSPIELAAEERAAVKAKLLQEAISAQEVRPPSTPIPELPDAPRVDAAQAALDAETNGLVPGGRAAQAMADEVRLAVEYSKADALNRWDQEEGLRDAFDYETRSFDEKKDLGVASGYDEVMPAEVMPAAGQAVPPVRPEPLRLTRGAEQPGFTLPDGLGRAAPRYGRATIAFRSDLDRTAYVLANDAAKPSKAAAKFREAVEAAGLSVTDVVAHGKRVKASLKQAAKGDPGQIELPAQPWRPSRSGGVTDEMAFEGWGAIDTAPFDTEKTRLEHQVMALKIIREVAGPDVSVRFEDEYLSKVKSAEWGGDGKATSLHGGFYRLQEDLIMVRGLLQGSERNVAEAAFHESFHRLQYLALGEKEAKVLDSLWSRVKVAVGSNHVTGSAGAGKPIAYSESQAVAFQRYAEAKRNGRDPAVAMLGGYASDTPAIQKAIIRVVAAFDRIADVIEKLFNRIALGAFDSTRAIFERARRGSLAEKADYAFEEPGSGFERMTASDGWRRQSWDLQPISSRVGDVAMRQQIEANNQTMDQIRRKAQQEGC